MSAVRRAACAMAATLAVLLTAVDAAAQARYIHDIALSRESFSPSKGESVQIVYTLAEAAQVTISVWDADWGLVRTVVAAAARKPGLNRDTWDGRDMDRRVVPDEAYFVTIEARLASGETDVYDPITFSGGEVGDVTAGEVSRRTGTIAYQLSQPSRVLLRAGIAGQAMLKTVVDWLPRPRGAVTEYWNGRDEDNVIDVLARKHTLILTYITLPASSVITVGNKDYSYRAYAASRKSPRPRKPDRPMANNRKISPHFTKSRLQDRAFSVRLSFPEHRTGNAQRGPDVKDRVLLRVEVDPADAEVIRDQQFEIIVFLDAVFHVEEERGYLPFNLPLEVSALPPGEHVVTVNVITFGDQIGVGSRRITVVR